MRRRQSAAVSESRDGPPPEGVALGGGRGTGGTRGEIFLHHDAMGTSTCSNESKNSAVAHHLPLSCTSSVTPQGSLPPRFVSWSLAARHKAGEDCRATPNQRLSVPLRNNSKHGECRTSDAQQQRGAWAAPKITTQTAGDPWSALALGGLRSLPP